MSDLTNVVDVSPAGVAALPSSPQDGDEVAYEVAEGTVWRFKYNAASASAYKWEFIGGPPLYAEVITAETSASTSYVNLTTTGPSITVPLAGEYLVTIGASAFNSPSAAATYMSFAVGGTGAVDNDAARSDASAMASVLRQVKKTVTVAATALVAKYRVASGTGNWGWRTMAVTPLRVG